MPKVIKGHAKCPECGDTQPVQFDSKKYFISCTACRTFTSYQSKEAKARIQNRLTPLPEPANEPEPKPEPVEGDPETKTNNQAYKPVSTPATNFLESLLDAL